MEKFEVKKHNFSDISNPVSIYTSLSTSTVNPLELEKDIEDFHDYIIEKYKNKSTKISFKQWITNKIKGL
jgi:hypothetical protein